MPLPDSQLLRYEISDWSQLALCKSNHDKQLYISVTNFIPERSFANRSTTLSGRRIEVCHPNYGVLFAYTMNPSGSMVVSNNDGSIIPELTVGQILAELQRFGFFIQYNAINHMSGPQIDFLMTLRDLHYDKIRILPVRYPALGGGTVKECIVAFKVEFLPKWLEATYVATISEFQSAAVDGHVFNVSTVAQHKDYDWTWLAGWVGDINDIIRDVSYLQP